MVAPRGVQLEYGVGYGQNTHGRESRRPTTFQRPRSRPAHSGAGLMNRPSDHKYPSVDMVGVPGAQSEVLGTKSPIVESSGPDR